MCIRDSANGDKKHTDSFLIYLNDKGDKWKSTFEVKNREDLLRLRAVSYTHLDVYKRQIFLRIKILYATLSFPLFINNKDVSVILPSSIKAG